MRCWLACFICFTGLSNIDMTDIHRATINRFWDDITPWEDAYIHTGLSFVAVRHSRYQLAHESIRWQLILRGAPLAVQSKSFESANIAAGHFTLSELELTPRALVDRIMASEPMSTPLGPIQLPVDPRCRAFSSFVTVPSGRHERWEQAGCPHDLRIATPPLRPATPVRLGTEGRASAIRLSW